MSKKLGIAVYSADAESVLNAIRPGVFSLKQGDTIQEGQSLETKHCKVTDEMKTFVESGVIYWLVGMRLDFEVSPPFLTSILLALAAIGLNSFMN